jgi:hypothetical protein
MSEVEVRDLSVESIEAQLGQLRDLTQIGPLREHTLRLNFLLDRDPEPMAGAVFAQAMLGIRQDIQFVVSFPEEHAQMRRLVRSGVASALARRGECVHWESGGDLLPLTELWHTWTPGAHEAMAPMFAAEETAESLFGPEHAVFVNPHLTSEPYGSASVTRLVRRWLTQVVAPGLSKADRNRYIAPPVFAVDQLVHNVREHAITPYNRTLVDSVVVLEVHTTRRRRHLRITVLDTGAGVVETLRPKVAATHGELDEVELLVELLQGELPGWDRGRGFGLATVAELVQAERQASLDLWTGATRIRVGSRVQPRTAAAEVTGTVVNAIFPLPVN